MCTAKVQQHHKAMTVKPGDAILELSFITFPRVCAEKVFVVHEGARELHRNFASSKIEPEQFAAPPLAPLFEAR